MTKLNKGFTLLEMIIVIAIITIMTVTISSNYLTAQKRARDARRRADAVTLQSALELYNNTNNSYPTINSITSTSWNTTLPNVLHTALVGESYISSLPFDPVNAGLYLYTYVSPAGTQYCIRVRQEMDASQFPNATQDAVNGGWYIKYGDTLLAGC